MRRIPLDEDANAATQAGQDASPARNAAQAADTAACGSLTDPEKVRLWQQRFFEAQASAEEYLMQIGGMEAIDGWIEANSSITARRFALVEPAQANRAAYAVARLVNQLRCYDSDIHLRHDDATRSYEMTNRDCGILRYRQEAARARVRLTFESPCEYCTRLNGKIIRKYVEGSTVDVDLAQGGCAWRIRLPPVDAAP